MPQVKISNKLPQVVTAGVVGPDGSVVAVQIAPRADSAPYDQDKLTEHTLEMVRLGHLRLRAV